MARTTKVGSAEYQLGADLKPLKKDLKSADAAIRKSGTAAEKAYAQRGTRAANKMARAQGVLVKQAGSLKKSMLAGFGVGGGIVAFSALASVIGKVAGEVGASLNAAADFEEQLAKINTVAKLSQSGLSDLGDDLKRLGREAGMTQAELGTAAYDLFSAGVSDASDVVDVLTDSTTLARAALSTTGEAVNLITSTLNAYKLEASESARVTDVFSRTVALGKVTASELAASIATVAPIAAEAGVSIEEVAASYAVMTATGIPAAEVATNMRAAIVAMLAPNAELNKIQKQTGVNFSELMRAEGVAAALGELSKAVDGDAGAMKKALGRVQAVQAALALSGDNADDFAVALGEMQTAGGSALSMMAERTDSYRFKQDKLNASIESLHIGIGNIMLGPAGDFAEWLTSLISPAAEVDEELSALRNRLLGIEGGAADAGEGVGLFQQALDTLATTAREGGNILSGQAFADLSRDLKLLNVQMDTNTAQVHAWAEALGTTDHWIEVTIASMLDQGLGIEVILELIDQQVTASEHVAESEKQAIVVTGAMGGKMLLAADGTIVLAQSLDTLLSAADPVPEAVGDAINAVPRAIRSGKAEAKEAMREYRFALEHPFQGKGYLKWLARKQQGVDRELRQAIKDGEPGRVDLASEMLADLQGKEADFRALRTASRQRGKDIIAEFMVEKARAKGVGEAYVQAIADGILSVKAGKALTGAAARIAGIVKAFWKTESPAKMGPLSEAGGPEGWGRRANELFAKGLGTAPPMLAPALTSGAMPALGGFGAAGGTQVVEHHHTITAEGAQAVAAAGFDEERLAQLLRSDSSDSRYRWSG